MAVFIQLRDYEQYEQSVTGSFSSVKENVMQASDKPDAIKDASIKLNKVCVLSSYLQHRMPVIIHMYVNLGSSECGDPISTSCLVLWMGSLPYGYQDIPESRLISLLSQSQIIQVILLQHWLLNLPEIFANLQRIQILVHFSFTQCSNRPLLV